MGLFRKNNEPAIRKWLYNAEEMVKRADDTSVPDLIAVFSTLVMKVVGSFFATTKPGAMADAHVSVFQSGVGGLTYDERSFEQAKEMYFKDSRRFDNDQCILEAFCLVCSKIDVWLYAAGRDNFRKNVFNDKVIPNCLGVFRNVLKINDIFEIFANRIALWGMLARRHADLETETHYLTQLLLRIENYGKLAKYDIERGLPAIVCDAFVTLAVGIHMGTFMKSGLSIIQDAADMLDEKLAEMPSE